MCRLLLHRCKGCQQVIDDLIQTSGGLLHLRGEDRLLAFSRCHGGLGLSLEAVQLVLKELGSGPVRLRLKTFAQRLSCGHERTGLRRRLRSHVHGRLTGPLHLPTRRLRPARQFISDPIGRRAHRLDDRSSLIRKGFREGKKVLRLLFQRRKELSRTLQHGHQLGLRRNHLLVAEQKGAHLGHMPSHQRLYLFQRRGQLPQGRLQLCPPLASEGLHFSEEPLHSIRHRGHLRANQTDGRLHGLDRVVHPHQNGRFDAPNLFTNGFDHPRTEGSNLSLDTLQRLNGLHLGEEALILGADECRNLIRLGLDLLRHRTELRDDLIHGRLRLTKHLSNLFQLLGNLLDRLPDLVAGLIDGGLQLGYHVERLIHEPKGSLPTLLNRTAR